MNHLFSVVFYSRGRGFFFLLVMAFFCFFSPADPSLAAPPVVPAAPSPCDPLYYDSLKARAWLEAQREITQNQNLIYKPDSVLEYTCFDKFLDVLAGESTNMFSETLRWGLILVPGSMSLALERLVGVALVSYDYAAFDYDLLGGRFTGEKYTPGVVFGMFGSDYKCDVMKKAWDKAKCMDFVSEPMEDGFYSFAAYRYNNDHRYLPRRCATLPAGRPR